MRLESKLDQEVSLLRLHTFAESTKRTYHSQLQLYLQFCAGLNVLPVPISTVNLGRYIAFLSSKFTFSSVRQYLNIVRLLHLEAGQPNPLSQSWYLASILKGCRRKIGDRVKQKLPITVDILKGILSVLDFAKPFDLCFWAACLVAFFSFFRKSNLLVPSGGKFDAQKHLFCSDVHFKTFGAVLSVRWSKTIQFKQRVLHVPLPRIKGSPFCPSQALMICLSQLPVTKNPIPLFCYPYKNQDKPLTHSMFVSHLRACLVKLGINPSLISGHSFRRGGASFSMQCGIPSELIKLQGDWNSNAYERYLDPSFSMRVQLASSLGRAFSQMSDTNL